MNSSEELEGDQNSVNKKDNSDRIEDLLQKAEYATSNSEADEIYDKILNIDIDYDKAWYKKWELKKESIKKFFEKDSTIQNQIKEQNPIFRKNLEYVSNNTDEIIKDMEDEVSDLNRRLKDAVADVEASAAASDSLEDKEADGGINKAGKAIASFAGSIETTSKGRKMDKIGKEYERKRDSLDKRIGFVEKLSKAISYFQNAIKAAPENYKRCQECKGKGVIIREEVVERFLLPDKTTTEREFCKNCYGMGRVRIE